VSPVHARRRVRGGLLAGVAIVVALSVAPGSPAGAAVSTAPLAASLVTADGSWVTVPMGHLSQLVNTFWQVFFRPAGSGRWVLVTPPGVADNGGLAVAPSTDGVTVGFEPNQLLTSSPLAVTDDGGATWTPGLVPLGLAAVPDALAPVSADGPLALVRRSGGIVLRGDAALTTWSPLLARATLAATVAGRSCGVGALTSLSSAPGGPAVVGTSCTRPGAVGIFTRLGGGWQRSGPRLGTATGTSVLRLDGGGASPSALVLLGRGNRTRLVAVWGAAAGAWTVSRPLAVGTSSIVSTGEGDGYAVVTRAAGGSLSAAVITGPGAAWTTLVAPPAGTQAAVVEGGTIDTLSVSGGRLTVWTLGGGTWHRGQVIEVPIQYGSSS